MRYVASHFNLVAKLKFDSLRETGETPNKAIEALDDLFTKSCEPNLPGVDEESPFIQVPETFLLSALSIFEHRFKCTEYKLFVFSDKSCVLSFRPPESKIRHFVPWPFALQREVRDHRGVATLYTGQRKPMLNYGEDNGAGISPLFGKDSSDCAASRKVRKIYQDRLRLDMRALVDAFHGATPIARDTSPVGLWTKGKEVMPYFADVDCVTDSGSSASTFADALQVHVKTLHPEDTDIKVFIEARRIKPSGMLGEPAVNIRAGYKHLGDLEKWALQILNEELILPRLQQINQKRTGVETLVIHHVKGKSDNRSAHEKMAAMGLLRKLQKQIPLQ